MPRRLHRDRKPVSSLADLDKARIALGVYLDKREFIEAILGRIRAVSDGGIAPAWAACIVLRMARLFFEELSWQNLGYLTRRLTMDEERAAAAQVVLLTFFPNASTSGEDDRSLSYGEAMRLWTELEKVAWG